MWAEIESQRISWEVRRAAGEFLPIFERGDYEKEWARMFGGPYVRAPRPSQNGDTGMRPDTMATHLFYLFGSAAQRAADAATEAAELARQKELWREAVAATPLACWEWSAQLRAQKPRRTYPPPSRRSLRLAEQQVCGIDTYINLYV